MESNEVEIEDAPPGYKSYVWQYFGFLIKKDKDGNRVTDKTKTVCKLCHAVIPYTTSNTSNMNHHLQRHHKNVKTAPEKTCLPKGKLTMKQALTPTLPPSSPRAKQITRLIGEFIADYMAPFNMVENRKFIQMFNVLEPKFKMPCRGHFSEKVIPEIYNETKQSVKEYLKNADCVALTTDSWTSRATQSYVTITAEVINDKWVRKSFVLQTRELSESHTGVNIAHVLRNALSEWELTRPQTTIACVTDNASNMDIAVRESGLHPHIKCLAHVVNLASKRGLAVSRVARLLGRVRRITTFFHRSTTATAVLTNKQTQLELPRHKLITDVQTRWNSTYEMLARYLEQQAAVSAALSCPGIRRNAREIDTLDNTDISDVEDIVKLLKPLKTATTVVCDEKEPTVSLIMPLKFMIEQSMSPEENDTQTIANMKSAILLDISDRYSGDCNDMLQECTALDPRFRSLSHLNDEQRESVYARIREKASALHEQRNQTSDIDERTTRASASTSGAAAEQARVMVEAAQGAEQSQEEPVEGERQMQDVTQPPPPKKTALEDLLGSSYTTVVETVQSSRGIEMEILSYRNGIPIPLNSSPLEWWKVNAYAYPILAPLAKAYLCIPATSVPSERVFSTAGDIVSAQRSLITPEHVDMLVFLKKNQS
ncbi:E3 SUMO-protein ligase ZBED1-like [Rhinichthys klamathensis goyatoka]|uniref:E3 SUMO-protein ligase ZBED1-like n=1 Tax=Rhinichthys klamathensis goyatoka TaxID=3034132 RepID=UPI0024B4B49A|nr:E3 SUMO-protein ligase ZBED1-like [Rhinichthys klamathensis goyatoka]